MPKEEAKKETPLSVTAVEVTLKCKDKATAESLKVFDSKKYKEAEKELKFVKHVSSEGESWRLIHDGENIIMFFKSNGATHTSQNMFVGTREECEKEIDKLSLKRK